MLMPGVEQFIFRSSCTFKHCRILPLYCFVSQRTQAFSPTRAPALPMAELRAPSWAVLTSVHAKVAFGANGFEEAVRPAGRTQRAEPQEPEGGEGRERQNTSRGAVFHLRSASKSLHQEGNR